MKTGREKPYAVAISKLLLITARGSVAKAYMCSMQLSI